jgi:cytochrome c oxidase subunit 2
VNATAHLRKPERNELRVEVVGEQWWWRVTYPDQNIETANEIRLPVGRPIEIGLDSDNVIHSFWVPQLAGKVDTIPGQHNTLRFTITKAGTYRGQCAEYCGLQHANMALLVIALPADEFDRWALQHSQAPSGPTSELQERGQLAFTSLPCAGCHTIRGTSATGTKGPDLTDFGERQSIGAETVPNNTGNLAGWIVNSQSIKPGNQMPPISVGSGELQALIAYLQSLK